MKAHKQKDKRKHRKRDSSSNSSSSSDGEYEWGEQTSENAHAPTKTEATNAAPSTWINEVHSVDQFVDMFASSSKSTNGKRVAQPEELGINKNELNPYWKDGGAGVPVTSSSSMKQSKLTRDNRTWLYKSYKGCVNEATSSGQSVEEILLQRWDANTVKDMLKTFGSSDRKHRGTKDLSIQRPYSSTSRDGSTDQPRWRKTTDASRSRKSPPSTLEEPPMPNCTEPSQSLCHRQERCNEESSDSVRHVEEKYATEEDINAMAAKVMRAELASDSIKLAKLNANLDNLREAKRRGIKVRVQTTRKTNQEALNKDATPRALPLTRLDDRGTEAPMHIPNLSTDTGSKRSKRVDTHDSMGRRIAYFHDDAKDQSIGDLLRDERYHSSGDMQREFSRLAAKAGRHVDDEYNDAFVAKRSNVQREAEHFKRDAVAAYKRRTFAESSCTTCLERVPKHLVVSLGEKVFLSLPGHVSLMPGHCLLTPYEHIGSMARVDETTLAEVIRFKRQLMTMCREQLSGSGIIFIETATRPDSAKAHTQIECLPVPQDLLQSVPAYFKKALSELGSEWSDNRQVIALRRPGAGVSGAVPPKFPYFSVEFGLTGGGLARIVHDDNDLALHFGREVIAGLMEKDHHLYRKPKPENFERLRGKVVEFESWWHSYNLWSQSFPKSSPTSDASHHHPLDEGGDSGEVVLPEGPELPC